MKKTNLLLITIVMSLMITSLIAAQTTDTGVAAGINSFIDGIKEVGNPLFSGLFGSTAGGGESLIIQILAFLLVMFVVYGILSTVGIFGADKEWINMVVGAIIAIIGIRFLPDGFLESMAVPSSAFVAILVLGLPFILLFFIIERSGLPGPARRASWAVYTVLIIVLWIYNLGNTNIPSSAKMIYPLGVLACLLVFWFDGTLHRWMRNASMARVIENKQETEKDRLLAEISDLTTTYNQKLAAGDNAGATRTRIRLERLEKALKAK